jgi:hypothetical protein
VDSIATDRKVLTGVLLFQSPSEIAGKIVNLDSLEIAIEKRPLVKFSLPQFEVVGLSFLELHADQIALTFIEHLAPFDLAGEKDDARAVQDLDA